MERLCLPTHHKMRGLRRVSADGGQPVLLTRPNSQAGELDHVWPEFLPGGKAVLFTITSPSGQLSDAQIAVLDLQTGKYKTVLRSGSHARYVETGHLIYGASGTLRAIAFDLDRLETIGSPIPVLSQVATTAAGAANIDVARDGTLAYVSGGVQNIALSLVWVDRQGREELLKAPPRAFVYPRLSPDGSQLALDIRDQDSDIWIWDLARETLRRLTRESTTESFPVWKPDGRHLIYTSDIGGFRNLYSQLADGSDVPPERITQSSTNQFAHSVTSDGKSLVLSESSSSARRDVMMLAFADPQHLKPLVHTQFVEQNPALSPNGRWLAYESNETGEFEVHVRPVSRRQQRTVDSLYERWTAACLASRWAGTVFQRQVRRRYERCGPAGTRMEREPSFENPGTSLYAWKRYCCPHLRCFTRWPPILNDQAPCRLSRRWHSIHRDRAELVRGIEAARGSKVAS